MQSVINFIVEHKAVILGVLLAVSEGLALNPHVRANSIFQLIYGMLVKAKPELPAA